MIPPQPLQPLGIGDIIDRSIKLYKTNFVKFIAIIALPQALAFFATSLITYITYQPAGQTDLELSKIILLLPAFTVGLIGWWVKLIAMGALVRVISEYYLGRIISVKEALGFILNKWPTLLGALILSSLFTLGGLLLFIIPGLILFFRYIFIIPVVSVEDLGVRASMKRSGFLSKGCAGKFFLISLCYFALISIFSVLITLPFAFLGFQSSFKGAPIPLPYQITQNFLQQILELIFSPFWMAALTLLYYDSRIRKEGFDLQVMAQHLGYEATATAAPAPLYPQPGFPARPAAYPAPDFGASSPVPPVPSPPPLSPSPTIPLPPLTLDFSPAPGAPPPPAPLPASPPPPPPAAAPAAPPIEPATPRAAFNPSPFGAKICPKCQASVPNISPKCPRCGALVPFKPSKPQ